MTDESLYNMGKEVGALQQRVADQGEAVKAIRQEVADERADAAQRLDDHNHGELEQALERAGVIEWVEEDSCWRVVDQVVRVVRPDKMEEG